MDKGIENQIMKLQLQGYGYKKIAATLALPVNSVKSFCKRHHVSETQTDHLKICLYCGKGIENTPHKKQKSSVLIDAGVLGGILMQRLGAE